jgi:hypothetical protein
MKMHPSIHYYVLSLSKRASTFCEGFRDKLIDIHDDNFPIVASFEENGFSGPVSDGRSVKDICRQTDSRFSHYFEQDPHRWVAVGEQDILDIFRTVSRHMDSWIGTVEGDYSLTSRHDLGKIVWPVVKEAIAGTDKNALHDLTMAAELKKVVFGIDAVGRSVETKTASVLYVEEDYHMRGSIRKVDHSIVVSKHVNLWEVIDDVVDLIIEKVLKLGGSVVFLKSGSLVKFGRIALVQSV